LDIHVCLYQCRLSKELPSQVVTIFLRHQLVRAPFRAYCVIVHRLIKKSLFFAGIALFACGDEAADGALYITWKLGALTCNEAAVRSVEASVYDYEQSAPRATQMTECVKGDVQLEAVPAGDYTLLLRGLDQDGCATHEVRRDVTVPNGSVSRLEELPLLRRQRDILANWSFGNQLDCLGNGVHQVALTIKVADLFERTYFSLCEGLETLISDDLPLGELAISVRGLDRQGIGIAYGRIVYDRDIFLSRPCDDSIRVQIPLEMCDLIECEGQR